MVGSELPSPEHRDVDGDRRGAAVGRATSACPALDGRPLLDDITFDIHRGEVLGIAGVEGNGQAELVESIMGMRHGVHRAPSSSPATTSRACRPATAARRGIGYIPEDRHRHGLLLDAPLWENRILGHQTRPPSVEARPDRQARSPARTPSGSSSEYDVRTPGPDVLARALSGGNQQKLIVGREMSGDPILLIAAHPTRGVDVGAQAAIWGHIKDARRNGLAVLLISADLDELIGLSDRIEVILRGRLVGTFDPERRHARAARLGDDRSGARRHDAGRVTQRCVPGAVSAPVLALAGGVRDHQPGAARRRRPGRRGLGPAPVGARDAQRRPTSSTTRTVLYLSGLAVGHRLPDEPVQHRRRRAVPRSPRSPPPSSPARPGCPATSTPRSRSSARWPSARCGPASPACCARPAASARSSRRSCSTPSRPALVAYLLRKVAVREEGSNVDRHQGDPRGQPDPQHPDRRRRHDRDLRLHRHRRRRRVRSTGSCSTGPGSASTCAPPAGRRPRPSPAASTSSRMTVAAMLLSGAVAGLVGPADPLRRRPTPTARRSSPGSASPASRSPCWAATTRSASRSARCCSPTSTSSPTRCRSWSGVSPDIVAITQGVIVLTVVISYEVVRRYGVRLEQQAVARACARAPSRPRRSPA